MSLLAIIGWILLGAVVVSCLVTFWDDIRMWLNNTAANAVEKVLGYGARERMHRAIARIDRIMNSIRNKTIVYTKHNELDTHYDKITLEAKAPVYEIKQDVLEEIRKKGELVQEFEYKK